MVIKGIFFDLDGTLADTAPDLAFALNETLKLNQKPALPFEDIRPVVSHGGRALIELGFGFGPESKNYESVRQQLLDIYLENIARHTELFPGMDELLQEIEKRNILWGVVTNKPGWLTEPLMQALQLDQRAASVVSGDTTDKAKPHPDPLFYACEQANVAPGDCIYIGDAERDITAGNAAGMHTVAALFGYIQAHDEPDQWQADSYIQNPLELIQLIESW